MSRFSIYFIIWRARERKRKRSHKPEFSQLKVQPMLFCKAVAIKWEIQTKMLRFKWKSVDCCERIQSEPLSIQYQLFRKKMHPMNRKFHFGTAHF